MVSSQSSSNTSMLPQQECTTIYHKALPSSLTKQQQWWCKKTWSLLTHLLRSRNLYTEPKVCKHLQLGPIHQCHQEPTSPTSATTKTLTRHTPPSTMCPWKLTLPNSWTTSAKPLLSQLWTEIASRLTAQTLKLQICVVERINRSSSSSNHNWGTLIFTRLTLTRLSQSPILPCLATTTTLAMDSLTSWETNSKCL